jgi:hypothetical protein
MEGRKGEEGVEGGKEGSLYKRKEGRKEVYIRGGEMEGRKGEEGVEGRKEGSLYKGSFLLLQVLVMMGLCVRKSKFNSPFKGVAQ